MYFVTYGSKPIYSYINFHQLRQVYHSLTKNKQQLIQKPDLFIFLVWLGGGFYNEQGVKSGNWAELHENFQDDCQVIYSGEYRNGLRFGQWTTLYENKLIGGGIYDEDGMKSGKWTDLHWYGFSVEYSGEYRNGLRFGYWTTISRGNGGGCYDLKGLKSGNWTDLSENLQNGLTVKYSGNYRNGIRFGEWTTLHMNTRIGGGNYNEKGIKSGKWTDLDENFVDDRVVHVGEYTNGFRVGEWNTLIDGKRIGGGYYNNIGVKCGQWIELHEKFKAKFELVEDKCQNYQVFYSGEYRNGLRFGEWTIKFIKFQLGNGKYDENGLKQGQWTELHEKFTNRCHLYYSGQYRNGLRIGRWKILYNQLELGGGNYDEKGVKSGEWTDIHENFNDVRRVVQIGHYSNGFKFGEWTPAIDVEHINRDSIIGKSLSWRSQESQINFGDQEPINQMPQEEEQGFQLLD